MTGTAGLRERKKSETRRAIADIALQLALEHGPDRVTVEDIAAGANVSPRTVFNYFSTKDEAILGIDPERRAELRAMVIERPSSETPLEAIAAVFTAVMTRSDDTGRLWRDRSRLVADYPHLGAAQAAAQTAMETELAAAVGAREGLPEDHPYCRLVVAAGLLVTRTALASTAAASNATLHRHLDAGFAILARGLTPPPPTR